MTTRETLLQAVIANSDDDGPRLIFADWLEENGQAEWAEFIRLGCRFHGVSEADARKTDESAKAWERMQALDFGRYQNSLLDPLRELGLKFGSERFSGTPSREEYYLWADFSRGFLEKMTLFGSKNLRQFCKRAEQIFAVAPLGKLGLCDSCGQAECWDWGGPAGYWDSEYDRISDRDLEKLLACPGLARIKTFEVWMEFTPARAVRFTECPTLSADITWILHGATEPRDEVARLLGERGWKTRS